jgi:hypothetical protein
MGKKKGKKASNDLYTNCAVELPLDLPRQQVKSNMTKKERKAVEADVNRGYAAERAAEKAGEAQAKSQLQGDMFDSDPYKTSGATTAAAGATSQATNNSKPNTAEKAHKEVEEEMVIEKGSPGDQKAGYKEGVEPEKGKADGKESKGVFAHLKQDLAHTKAAFGEASDIIGGGAKTVDGADSITDSADAYKQLKKTGGDYLSNMGRGHKGLGAAKLGAYMVGTSMLVDMLNPFDDD